MRTPILVAVLLLLVPPSTQASGLQNMVNDYLTVIAQHDWEARAAKVAALQTPAEVAARQQYIRTKVLDLIGGFPARTPLNARITGILERDGYRIERLIYESQPRFYVTANLYLPTHGKPPYPAVLGPAGHYDLAKAEPVYQRAWISLAKRGFVVLAYDPPGQGERMESFDPDLGRQRFISTQEHMMEGLQCLLNGANFARYELWDGIRGIDYLTTRREVDPKRIAVAGQSGGGTQTALLQVVEPRLTAAAPACYITSWEKLWGSHGPQDSEQVFPGFLKDGLDFADFLIAFAPRPVKIVAAIRDAFPIEGTRTTYAEAQRIFGILGAGDHVGIFESDDEHAWSKPMREATYAWFEKWLKGSAASSPEPAFDTEPEFNLQSTESGQLSLSLPGETVQTLNRKQAEQLYLNRRVARPGADIRTMVTRRLAIEPPVGQPVVLKRGETAHDGYRIEEIALQTEPGITVPALLLLPDNGGQPKPAIIYVDSAGKAAAMEDLVALVKTGRIVLSPELRGWGESRAPNQSWIFGSGYQTAMRALLVGKTMAGMQLYDLLSSLNYLLSRGDVDPAQISLIGKGNGGVVALYAALLDQRIRKVACEGSVLSYLQVAQSRFHENLADIIVPGVLQDFDLPDVGAAIAPRTLWIVSPRTPMGAVIPSSHCPRLYKDARVLDRPQDWPADKVYGPWLQ